MDTFLQISENQYTILDYLGLTFTFLSLAQCSYQETILKIHLSENYQIDRFVVLACGADDVLFLINTLTDGRHVEHVL